MGVQLLRAPYCVTKPPILLGCSSCGVRERPHLALYAGPVLPSTFTDRACLNAAFRMTLCLSLFLAKRVPFFLRSHRLHGMVATTDCL